MHAITSYCVRCYNKEIPDKENKYAPLDNIRGVDAFDIISDSLSSLKDQEYQILDESKQIFIISKLEFDNSGRLIRGVLEVGKYGTKNDIINIQTKKVDYEKLKNHAEMVKYYFLFYIPKSTNEGIALLQVVGNSGVKTILHNQIAKYFKDVTGLNLQMNPLAYEKAFNEWANGNVTELILNRFKAPSDLSDAVESYTHNSNTSVLTTSIKNNFGKLKNYFNRASDESKLVEVIMENCSSVKASVEIGGKKRTFKVNRFDTPSNVCQIEIEEPNVKMEDGNPTYESLDSYCLSILEEQKEALYPFSKGTT